MKKKIEYLNNDERLRFEYLDRNRQFKPAVVNGDFKLKIMSIEDYNREFPYKVIVKDNMDGASFLYLPTYNMVRTRFGTDSLEIDCVNCPDGFGLKTNEFWEFSEVDKAKDVVIEYYTGIDYTSCDRRHKVRLFYPLTFVKNGFAEMYCQQLDWGIYPPDEGIKRLKKHTVETAGFEKIDLTTIGVELEYFKRIMTYRFEKEREQIEKQRKIDSEKKRVKSLEGQVF
jgi:hypothetical protein